MKGIARSIHFKRIVSPIDSGSSSGGDTYCKLSIAYHIRKKLPMKIIASIASELADAGPLFKRTSFIVTSDTLLRNSDHPKTLGNNTNVAYGYADVKRRAIF